MQLTIETEFMFQNEVQTKLHNSKIMKTETSYSYFCHTQLIRRYLLTVFCIIRVFKDLSLFISSFVVLTNNFLL